MKYLLNIAVVTIRTMGGREIDLTDHLVEYRRRVKAGRTVMNTAEIRALQGAGESRIGKITLDVKDVYQGAEVEEGAPSSGPYPWDEAKPEKKERKEDDGQGRLW
jgi:hypothetical protein